jgi:hypothetical protein
LRGSQPNKPFDRSRGQNRGSGGYRPTNKQKKKNKMPTFRKPTNKETELRWVLDQAIRDHGLPSVLRALSHYAGSESIYSTWGEETRLLKQYWDLSNGLDRLIEQFKATNPNEFVPEEFEEEGAA